MSGSVENNSNSNQGSQLVGIPVNNTVDTSPAGGVAVGYSAESSSEVVQASPASESGNVNLDQPEAALQTEDLETLASNQRLAGLKEIVGFFNERFDIDTLDMADTASVLLLIKGMVSDMRALSGAENIDSALQELLTQYDGYIAIARSIATKANETDDKKTEKEDNEATLATRHTELETKKQTLEGKKLALTGKQGALAGEGLSDSDKEQLESEIEMLQQQIATLNTEISGLQNTISGLKANITGLEADLDTLAEDIKQLGIRLKAELSSSLERLFSITEGIRQRYDRAALETGEEQRVVTAAVNTEDDKEHGARKQQFRTEKQVLYEQNGRQVEDQIQREKDIADASRLAQVLNEGDIAAPDRLLAVLDTLAVEKPGAVSDNQVRELPANKELLETAKVFEAVLTAGELPEPDKSRTPEPQRVDSPYQQEPLLQSARTVIVPDDQRLIQEQIKPSEVRAVEQENKVTPVQAVRAQDEGVQPRKDISQQSVESIQQNSRDDALIKPSSLPVSSMAETLQKMEAMRLESEALALVIEAEKERLATERAISKNSPV